MDSGLKERAIAADIKIRSMQMDLHGTDKIKEERKMDGIGQYQAVSSIYQESRAYAAYRKNGSGAAGENNRTEETQDGSRKAGRSESYYEKTDIMDSLSADAKKLLEELKEKYGNVDFFVGNYSSEKEAGSYLQHGRKEYGVLLEPELLEQMASDEKAKEKYVGLIDSSMQQLDRAQEQLGDKKDMVSRMGVSISSQGEVSFFADLEKMSENQRERIDKSREAKKEKAAKDAAKAERDETTRAREEKIKESRGSRVRLHAETLDGLIEKIRRYEPKKEQPVVGSSFDAWF